MKTTKFQSECDKQANDFLMKTGATIKVKFSKHAKHFQNDKEARDIYNVTISRGSRSYSFKFGQSTCKSGLLLQYGKNTIKIMLPDNKKELADPKNRHLLRHWVKKTIMYDITLHDEIKYPIPPTAYDILSCLQKYDVGTFEDFCEGFGYDADSRNAEKTYKAVCCEYENLCRLFSDEEMVLMQEIN